MPQINLSATLQAYSKAPFYSDWVRDVTSQNGLYNPIKEDVNETGDKTEIVWVRALDNTNKYLWYPIDLSSIVNKDTLNSFIERLAFLEETKQVEAKTPAIIEDNTDTLATINSLESALKSHIENTSNPHNTTQSQLCLLGLTDPSKVSLESDTTQQINSNMIINGNLGITENLNIIKNLSVEGNLVVEGEITTRNLETVTVKDSLIVLNSENELLGNNLAGIAIKTGTSGDLSDTAYGIAYCSTTDELCVGKGSYEDGKFRFTEAEYNPILTRAAVGSEDLKDGAMFVWDATKGTAVTKDILTIENLKSEFVTKAAYDELLAKVQELSGIVATLTKNDK